MDETSNGHIDNGNGMFKTMKVNDLPQLAEELIHLTERSTAKNGLSSNEASFELFENYDVLIASTDSTTTYTLPVIQSRENNRQFSNLVLTYTNYVLTNSFVLKYEGTQEYFDQRVINKEIPFSGIMSLVPVSNTTDLFAKNLVCEQVNITYCRWPEDQEHNVWHQAGPDCGNSSLMITVPATVCTNESLTFDDGQPNNGGGGSNIDDPAGPTGRDDGEAHPVFGGANGYPVDGTYTHPVSNPTCEEDPLSLTEGGCYDPLEGDILELDDQDLLVSEYYLQNDIEPEKQHAGTVDDFIDAINNSDRQVGLFKGQTASDYLKSLSDTEFNFTQMRPLPTQTGFYNTIKGRYIYTKKGGWIDVAHFMFYAGKAYNYKLEGEANPIGEAVQDGYAQENSDLIVSSHSAFSYEDLPSDKFGAEFAVNHFDINSNLTFGEQINNYFSNVLEAVAPEIAPNFESIPESDSRNSPSRTNDSTAPVYTVDNP